jgi:hypothetical protein
LTRQFPSTILIKIIPLRGGPVLSAPSRGTRKEPIIREGNTPLFYAEFSIRDRMLVISIYKMQWVAEQQEILKNAEKNCSDPFTSAMNAV